MIVNLNGFKERVTEIKAERGLLIRQVETSKKEHEKLLIKLEHLEEASIIFQKAAKITQEQISFHIENIVSSALAAVFDNPYTFRVKFITRRNSLECDLLFVDSNGEELNPLDSCGYGAADVASLALRIAYWKMSENVRNTIITDEPLRSLSLDKQPLASMMISRLSKELELQLVVVTHNEALIKHADKVFKVKKIGGHSQIKEIS